MLKMVYKNSLHHYIHLNKITLLRKKISIFVRLCRIYYLAHIYHLIYGKKLVNLLIIPQIISYIEFFIGLFYYGSFQVRNLTYLIYVYLVIYHIFICKSRNKLNSKAKRFVLVGYDNKSKYKNA